MVPLWMRSRALSLELLDQGPRSVEHALDVVEQQEALVEARGDSGRNVLALMSVVSPSREMPTGVMTGIRPPRDHLDDVRVDPDGVADEAAAELDRIIGEDLGLPAS